MSLTIDIGNKIGFRLRFDALEDSIHRLRSEGRRKTGTYLSGYVLRDLVQFRAAFRYHLGRIDDVHRCSQGSTATTDATRTDELRVRCIDELSLPSEVRHFHHDHAHLLGKNDDIVATIVPLEDLTFEVALRLLESFHLQFDLFALFLGQSTHHVLVNREKQSIDTVTRFPFVILG